MHMEEEQAVFHSHMGKTARVWEIADELTQQTGRRAQRKEVILKYQAEGGNINTASTQYSKWHAVFKESKALNNLAPRLGNTSPLRLVVGGDGRLLLPSEVRAAMMLDKTGVVTVRVVNGELRILTPACAIEKMQNLIASSDQGSGSVVDELILERRAESDREN